MLGWKIFVHSLRMVLRNWRAALRIFLVPSLIGVALFALSLPMIGDSDLSTVEASAGLIAVAVIFISIFALIVIMFWCVVSWHRFVLLEEMPQGWVPTFRMDRILSYMGHGFLLTLVVMVCAIPALLLITVAAKILPVTMWPILGSTVGVLISSVIYRISAVLPAAALGKSIKLGAAFKATEGATGSFIVLAFILVAANYLFNLTVPVLLSVSLVLGTVVSVSAFSIMGIVNISILTTIYGHYVEGRQID